MYVNLRRVVNMIHCVRRWLFVYIYVYWPEHILLYYVNEQKCIVSFFFPFANNLIYFILNARKKKFFSFCLLYVILHVCVYNHVRNPKVKFQVWVGIKIKKTRLIVCVLLWKGDCTLLSRSSIYVYVNVQFWSSTVKSYRLYYHELDYNAKREQCQLYAQCAM